MVIKCLYFEAHVGQLGGNDFIVEIDESAFNGKQKHHVGRRSKTRWVFGMVERGTGRCKLVVVNQRDRDTLIPIIQQYIANGARINSDEWRAYWVLGEYGYMHQMVNHSLSLVDETTGTHTNIIEGVWKWAKRDILYDGGCQDHLLQEKLDYYCFRKTFLNNIPQEQQFQIMCKIISEYWVEAKRVLDARIQQYRNNNQ
eukprot:12985_1